MHDESMTFRCLYVRVISKDTQEVKINCKLFLLGNLLNYVEKAANLCTDCYTNPKKGPWLVLLGFGSTYVG
jgi:hypothetical protein